MKKYLEKKIRKYVIATLDNPTLYLRKTPSENEYCFVEDVEMATKALNATVIKQILQYYHFNTGLNTELVVIPLEITYELIDEEQN